MAKQLTIEYVSVDKLKLNPKNPRKNDDNVSAVVKSMESFGWTNPILVRRANDMVIAGHTRLKAAIAEGLAQVPVVYLDLNETDADVYMVADNKLTENAEWDLPKLADLLVDFDQIDVDLDLTGFSMAEIEDIAPATFGPPERDDDDNIPESPPPICKTGDLWLLGSHRLLCGDCTIQANVERLMAGEKADMVFTDPPYGVGVESWDKMNLGELLVFTEKWVRGISGRVKEAHNVFASFLAKYQYEVRKIFSHYFQYKQTLIWHYANTIGGGGYRKSSKQKFTSTYQPIFLFGNKDLCEGKPNRFDVIVQATPQSNFKEGKIHIYQKPLALLEKIISYGCCEKDIALDPFLGSGTTLIACEKLGRKCYGMEIDEKYCDVIIKRWEDYTGGKAVLDESP